MNDILSFFCQWLDGIFYESEIGGGGIVLLGVLEFARASKTGSLRVKFRARHPLSCGFLQKVNL
jgi:hypothetical protein